MYGAEKYHIDTYFFHGISPANLPEYLPYILYFTGLYIFKYRTC